jgi:hypothetical protein
MKDKLLLKARVPHNYVLWAASHFHPAMHKTKKVLPCCGKRYCFVIDGVPCTPHGPQTSYGFFFFPGGYRNNNGTYNNSGLLAATRFFVSLFDQAKSSIKTQQKEKE